MEGSVGEANQPAIPESGAPGLGALTQSIRDWLRSLSPCTHLSKLAGLRHWSVVHRSGACRTGAAEAGPTPPNNVARAPRNTASTREATRCWSLASTDQSSGSLGRAGGRIGAGAAAGVVSR